MSEDIVPIEPDEVGGDTESSGSRADGGDEQRWDGEPSSASLGGKKMKKNTGTGATARDGGADRGHGQRPDALPVGILRPKKSTKVAQTGAIRG